MATNYNQVGVKVGDTADYKVSTSAGPDNRTRLYFTYVSGAMVSADELSFWPNGTIHSSTSWTGNISNYQWPIYIGLVVPGLKVGDHIGTGSSSPVITDNTTLIAAGSSRLAIHASNETFLIILLSYVDGYWDEASGLLIKGNFYTFLTGWFNATLISTTVRSQGGALSMTTVALIEGGVIVVLVIAMVFVARRHVKHG
jgi:hypothetical protein